MDLPKLLSPMWNTVVIIRDSYFIMSLSIYVKEGSLFEIPFQKT